MDDTFIYLTSTAWTAIAAIAAGLTTIVAATAAVLALRQLRQGRELSEEQARPYILVLLEYSEATSTIAELVIRNVGLTAARSVTLAIDPPFERVNPIPDTPFMEADLFRRPIPTMPPGFELRVFFEDIREHARADREQSSYLVSISYLDRNGRKLRDEFVLDLDTFKGSVYTEIYGLHHIAKFLRAIAKKYGVTSF